MEVFKNYTNGFNFIYERKIPEKSEIIVKMPVVSANKRSINDIGWQCDGDIAIYGTLSASPESKYALWQEIRDYDEVNKTISALKIINKGDECRIAIRVILC